MTVESLLAAAGLSGRIAPPVEVDANTAVIPVGTYLAALVDADEYAALAKFHWTVQLGCNPAVPVSKLHDPQGGRSTVYMHRVIMGCAQGDGTLVVHANGYGLDNRRSNLRFATRAEIAAIAEMRRRRGRRRRAMA